MVPAATQDLTARTLTFGTLQVDARRALASPAPRSIQRVGTGSNTERSSRPGQTPIVYNDLSGGMRQLIGVMNWASIDITTIFDNDGIQTRPINGKGGLGILPELITNQASMTSEENISGFIAANKLGHGLITALGDTGQRFLLGLGINILGDTSLTDPALKVRGSAGSDYITAAANLRFNSTDYAAFSFKNVADATGVVGITNVSGSGALSSTQLIAPAAANDAFYAMQYCPDMHSNILVGVYNGVSGWWYVKDDVAIPAVPQPLCFEDTKDVEGTLAVVTVGPVAPIAQAADTKAGLTWLWSGGANTLTSDNTYATAGSGSGTGTTYPFTLSFTGQFGSGTSLVPQSAIVKGLQPQWEAHEAAAGNNLCYYSVTVNFGGVNRGVDRGDESVELSTSDHVDVFGAVNDTFDLSLTGADLGAVSTTVEWRTVSTGGSSPVVSLDTGGLSVTYRMPGHQIPANFGGNGFAPSPTTPDTVGYLEPLSSESTTRTQPRRLVLAAITWDAAGNRPVAMLTFANTGMRHVHSVTPFQGGYLCIGAEKPGTGRFVKLIDSNGQTRNLNFPGFRGTTEIRINNVCAQGEWAIFEVVNADFSDLQNWYWYAGKWYADTLKQSLSGQSVALQPIIMAENVIAPHQSILYNVYPRTTHTAVRRMFLAPDLGQDPRATNTTQLKTMATVSSAEDTKVYVIGVEIDFGPEEANKAILSGEYLGRSISASSTVQFGFNVTGTGSVSAPAGSNTFTGAYTTYNVLSAGAAYRTFQPWWGLAHTTGTANTPNCLSTLIYSTQQFEEKELYVFECDPTTLRSATSSAANDFWGAINDMITMVNTKLTFALSYSNINENAPVPVVLDDWNMGRSSGILTSGKGQPQQPEDFNGVSLFLTFRQVVGTAASS